MITRKDIIEYRALEKKSWHDENWHKKMSTKKAEAIGYAITTRDIGDTYKDTIAKAEKYLADIGAKT